jgi:hypothetical protein
MITHILIAAESIVHVTRGILIQFLVVAENNNGYVDGTENSELMRLLEEATLSLQKCTKFRNLWSVMS